MKHRFGPLFFSLLFWLNTLSATTIIPFRHLGEAASTADAVVLATAGQRLETVSGDLTLYDCRFEVNERVIGNPAAGESLVLRQYAHRYLDYEAEVAGDFVPEAGKTYLLFLREYEGYWRPLTLSYYVFEVKMLGGESFLVPVDEGFGFSFAPRPDGVQPEPVGVYRLDALLPRLRQYGKGRIETWDATAAQTGLTPDDFPKARVIPTGCDFDLGSGLCRWQSTDVEYYYDDTDVPAGFSATLNSILGDITGNYPGVTPSNEGQAAFTPNCMDGTVTGDDFTLFVASLNGNQTGYILFDDPCSQIANLSGCSGTLAIGGGYSSSSTHMYKGDTWKNALWGYVVVNNGTLGCLSAADYEIMLTHELTHSFRMDHLNAGLYPDQNMNPSCCNPIAFKDEECMNYVYDLNLPVELTRFDAQWEVGKGVLLEWETLSEADNDYFVVERSADGLRFETLCVVPGLNTSGPHHYDRTDPLPAPGMNYYRLSQVDFDGQVNSLGVRAVRVDGVLGESGVFPNPAGDGVVTVKAGFSGDFDGFLEISDLSGRIVERRALVIERGTDTVEQPVGALAPGMYRLSLQSDTFTRVFAFLKK